MGIWFLLVTWKKKKVTEKDKIVIVEYVILIY